MTLKFRAWLIKEKKMVGVSDLLLAGGGIIQTSCEDSDYDGLSKVVGRDCVLMRSLGMTDKNGREIYEGDVLGWPKKKDRFEIEEDPCYPGTLAMMGKYGDFYGPLSASRAKKTVVLGNRFEDPNLLKDGICGR